MTELVFIKNDRPVTDSITVAEEFGKEHKNVMRDINNQIEKLVEAGESTFVTLNFERISYKDGLNRDQSKFLMTEDAFALVTMSYVTVEAMKFKVKFISEFNRMKIDLIYSNSAFELPRTFSDSLRLLAAQIEETEVVKSENKRLALQASTLELQVEKDKPKTIFADAVSTSNDSILVGQLATILKQNGVNIGQTRLFNILREEGYLCKSGERRNLPTQKAMELKLFEIKEFTVHGNSGIKVKNTPKVTGRGQIYFINKFLKHPA